MSTFVSPEDSKSTSVDLQVAQNRPVFEGSTSLCSSVVIRRAHSLLPAFSKLSQNADLNCPPPNWLRSDNPSLFAQHQNRTQNVSFTSTQTDDSGEDPGHVEPTSVTLASHYPTTVGHVDVVADAKNIKKLLKLPYSNSLVSLAIHRAGKKTLLIDDFNAPLLLNRVANSNLERLFRDNPALNPSRYVHFRKKDPENTHHRNMLSKLLYYSAQEDSSKALVPVPTVGRPSTNQLSISDSANNTSQVTDANDSRTDEDSTQPRHSQEDTCTCSADLEETTSQPTECSLSTGQEESTQPIELEDSTQSVDLEESILSTDLESTALVKSMLVPARAEPLSVPSTQSITTTGEDTSDQKTSQKIPSQQLSSTVPQTQDSGINVSTSPVRASGNWASKMSDIPSTDANCACEAFPNQPPHVSPQPFYQNVHWSVKDTSMLLGSDLPIFGIDGHPAISLRLRDKKKPITVLTGMEYWLDNLMCNVPELAMCFHVDGILQNYHIVKTEDIPELNENCQFSPEEVLDMIRSILGFLKANCTREGHTYWLFRKKGEDVVKLYDLTTLNCFKDDEDKNHNPFAKSVATLFYRVAHNMLTSGEELSCEELAMAKVLLENCIKLIADWDKEICLSAYYLLADLFLNKAPLHPNLAPSEPKENSSPSDSVKEESRDVMSSVIQAQTLSVSLLREGGSGFPVSKEIPPLIVDSSLDRARLALEQVSSALVSLGCAGPWVPGKLAPKELIGTSKLLAQASSAYYLLAEVSLDQNKLGRALRYGKYSVLCSRASLNLQNEGVVVPVQTPETLSSVGDTLCQVWQICGDIHCLSTKLSDAFSANLEDFQSMNPEDSSTTKLAQFVIDSSSGLEEKEVLCLSLHTDLETSLLRSVDCYQLAASHTHTTPSHTHTTPHTLEERLGNAWNELGVYYLQVASNLDFTKEPRHVEKLWKSSFSCISDGLAQFKKTGNVVNQALLLANLGKLMSSCAQAHGHSQATVGVAGGGVVSKGGGEGISGEVREYSQQEKLYYSKSVEYYLQAKQTLRRRSTHPGIWTNVIVDLSGVCLTMGTAMLRHPPLSYLTQQEVFQEVNDVLSKALFTIEPELATLDKTHPRYTELCRLIGDCHSRLGDLHHQNSLSPSLAPQKVKHLRTLADKHYSKAVGLYQANCHSCELLELRLTYAQFLESHAQGKSRLKGLQSSLSCLLGAVESVKAFLCQPSPPSGSSVPTLCHSLMEKLVEVLKQLLITSKKKSESTPVVRIPIYKQMYGEALLNFQQIQATKKLTNDQVCLVVKTLSELNQCNQTIMN